MIIIYDKNFCHLNLDSRTIVGLGSRWREKSESEFRMRATYPEPAERQARDLVISDAYSRDPSGLKPLGTRLWRFRARD